MNRAEHYAAAERLLQRASDNAWSGSLEGYFLQAANAHAILATTDPGVVEQAGRLGPRPGSRTPLKVSAS